MEEHDPRDHALRQVFRQRHGVHLPGSDIDSRTSHRATTLTLDILRRLTEQQADGSVRGQHLPDQLLQARQRLELVSTVTSLASAVQRRAEACSRQLRRVSANSRELTRHDPTPQPDMSWVTARADELRARVEQTTAAYTITNSQVVELGWGDLREQLTRGQPSQEGRPVAFPKAEIKRFLGVLKLVHELQADPIDSAARLGDALADEAGLRQQISELLTHREHLDDSNALVELLTALHLDGSVSWARDHWRVLAPIVEVHATPQARWLDAYLKGR